MMEKDGEIIYLKEQIYHVNPMNNEGSLVTYDWGYDFIECTHGKANMTTTVLNGWGRKRDIKGELIEVPISKNNQM
ncbi:MAG: hypothetical protein KAH86_05070 [Methanosarcinales archaeon]|nr:hypothetical protein [Methanosarcinales archaeon]